MKHLELNKIKKAYFGYEEVSRALGITLQSARVSANRYVKQGLLVRVKRNIYVLSQRWKTLSREEKFILANLIQVPSYISLMTAMDYHEVTTQIQRDFIESVGVKRTRKADVGNTVFTCTRINEKLYFGFARKNRFFIATPEKAFLDALYLMSLGRYSFDLASIDLSRLDADKVRRLALRFPLKTRKFMEKNGYFKRS